ncbi:hypothetical protein CHUAL_010891 [Chamberlinius hualienensis]
MLSLNLEFFVKFSSKYVADVNCYRLWRPSVHLPTMFSSSTVTRNLHRRFLPLISQIHPVTRTLCSQAVHNANAGRKESSSRVRQDLLMQGDRGPDQQQISVEDVIWDMFKNKDGKVAMGKFLATLRATGLRKTDPRLKELMDSLKNCPAFRSGDVSSTESLLLDEQTFKAVVLKNIVLISRALRGQFIIPDFTGFTKQIEEFYWKCKSNHGGKVANYIPQLARYSPDYWGVSLCTVDGQRFSIGDVDVPFTVQSCAKPISYAIALDAIGSETVHKFIGQEPSGRMFNELVLDYTKKPHNPMINAGAIVNCSILLSLVKPEMTLSDKFDHVANYFKRLAGNEFLGFSNATFLSERETGDRNYALGFYMRENKCFPDKSNLKETLDFYFQLCSMETNCDAFSVIAATLANGGICPITEESVLKSFAVRDMLSLMHSCGMYDYSGQFAFKIGLPAKSGVSGAIIVVIPNVMGICLWSPPLDALGNTVRGVQFCEELVQVFNFHRYDNLKHTAKKRDPRRHKFETKGLQIVNLLFSAASGDITAMRRHFLSGLNMAQCDYDGRTALHLAAAEGHIECVEFLLKQCMVPPSPKDRWGHTPIDDAKTFQQHEIVKMLEECISHWSEPSEPENKGDLSVEDSIQKQ